MQVKKRPLSTRWLIAAGACAAAFQAVASLPASLLPALGGFERAGIRYETATGTIWDGALTGIEVSNVAMGDAQFAIAPFSLLSGKVSAAFAMSGGALSGGGVAWVRPSGLIGVRDSQIVFKLDAATRFAFLGEPLNGVMRADVSRLEVSKKGCVASDARLSTNVLAGPARRFDSQAFDLSGESVCDGDDLLVTLSGQGAEGAVTLTIRIAPTMAYSLAATANPARRDVAEALQVMGFQEEGGTLKIAANGVIRSVGS